MTSRPPGSACPTGTDGRWAGSWTTAPRIVAESLRAVADPLRTGLRPGPVASGAAVARALARSLTPAEHPGCPPGWLLPGQVRSFRRALAALDRYGGALLAEPVGSGKTYVALAVAARLQGAHPTACLVPATLLQQWRAVAARVGVRVDVGTHQMASRGRLPACTRGLVIVDESHHFRNPHTRRYAHVAPWLVGRPVLLLSATPVVNRLDDLAHQLLLGARDDALVADGMVSLRSGLAAGRGLAGLGNLVIEDTSEAGPRPARRSGLNAAPAEENRLADTAIRALACLRLSTHPPIAALLRSVLHRAVASSPAALAGALRRYQALLRHAEEARQAGRSLTRTELRDFAGELDDQLVLWALLSDSVGGLDLCLDDLAQVDGLVADAGRWAATVDPKLERLRVLLADRRPTVVFCTRRETVRHLRDRLSPPAVAWCTGERAGLGHLPAPRAAVLEWFRDPRAWHGHRPPPTCLVVTDVAAEGLDLRLAARVVHYDLPWTPMRLEQREGRAVRLGSDLALVDVVRFVPPPALDAVLAVDERLRSKAALPALAGLGAGGARLWRWRSALADRLGDGPGVPGIAFVPGDGRAQGGGLLAGFELTALRRGARDRVGCVVGWLGADDVWREDETSVTERLLMAAEFEDATPPDPELLRQALDRLAGPVRARLAIAAARRWSAAEPDGAARRLAERLGALVRDAARRRDGPALARLEHALAFVAGGHTAGEALLVRRLAEANDRELADAARRMPAAAPRWDAIDVRLCGVVVFGN
ncbi:MAG TPA: DEAD/DEAH box helicase [Gemmatimonadales bacterium]|nr:DEAD/DEAH box helicase [Gemmatimonadales bacterium]